MSLRIDLSFMDKKMLKHRIVCPGRAQAHRHKDTHLQTFEKADRRLGFLESCSFAFLGMPALGKLVLFVQQRERLHLPKPLNALGAVKSEVELGGEWESQVISRAVLV